MSLQNAYFIQIDNSVRSSMLNMNMDYTTLNENYYSIPNIFSKIRKNTGNRKCLKRGDFQYLSHNSVFPSLPERSVKSRVRLIATVRAFTLRLKLHQLFRNAWVLVWRASLYCNVSNNSVVGWVCLKPWQVSLLYSCFVWLNVLIYIKLFRLYTMVIPQEVLVSYNTQINTHHFFTHIYLGPRGAILII